MPSGERFDKFSEKEKPLSARGCARIRGYSCGPDASQSENYRYALFGKFALNRGFDSRTPHARSIDRRVHAFDMLISIVLKPKLPRDRIRFDLLLSASATVLARGGSFKCSVLKWPPLNFVLAGYYSA